MADQVRVLSLCLGNICRSPLGEALLRHHAEKAGLGATILVDSAGTAGWHEGKPPHEGSQRVALRHGLDISAQRARQITPDDLATFDLILAMDEDNLASLKRLARRRGDKGKARLERFMAYGLGEQRNVPDPYGEPDAAFEEVFQMLDRAAQAAIARLTSVHGLNA